MRLKGKVALITGSTRGIGKEFAMGFAREGADVIVNGRNLEKIKEEGWDQVLDVNLKGVFLCCQAVGRKMIEQGGGKIINISSGAGILGEQGLLPYCVSKAGVMMLTRILAYEWSRYHITVNAIAPGFVEGGMTLPILNKEILVSGLSAKVPLNRL